MANEVLLKVSTTTTPQISFANHAGDYVGGAAANTMEVGTPTDVELDLDGLTNGSAAQSAKADFGEPRAALYSVDALFETQATPTTGNVVQLFFGCSTQSTAANGNPGYLTGTAGAYTGTPATLAEGVLQLIHLGNLICSADAEAQIQHICNFMVPTRYGILVVKNECGATFVADGFEHVVVFTPITHELQ